MTKGVEKVLSSIRLQKRLREGAAQAGREPKTHSWPPRVQESAPPPRNTEEEYCPTCGCDHQPGDHMIFFGS